MPNLDLFHEELDRYVRAKSELDARVTRDLERCRSCFTGSSTAWLFSSVAARHADLSAQVPGVKVAQGADARAAKKLQKKLDKTLADNFFAQMWSDAAYTKLLTGSVCWAVTASGGAVRLSQPDLRSVFWEPGCLSLDDSEAVYVRSTVLPGRFYALFPKARGRRPELTPDGRRVVVTDRYSVGPRGLELLRFSGDAVIFDSAESGGAFRSLGTYPLVIDRLYPDDRSPAGYGYFDLYGGVQRDIDRLNAAITDNVCAGSRRRYFCRVGGGVNEREFADESRPIVHVANSFLGEDSIREITPAPLPAISLGLLESRIAELKSVSFNRDAVSGGTETGVTSGTAINALQQAAMKASNDISGTSERAMHRLFNLTLSLLGGRFGDAKVVRNEE
ncbi:MAG: hypothetical protein K6C36_04760 [Clostridia bacterium]|nr:hypothetical protein [Clostridia bacterium]